MARETTFVFNLVKKRKCRHCKSQKSQFPFLLYFLYTIEAVFYLRHGDQIAVQFQRIIMNWVINVCLAHHETFIRPVLWL